MIEELVEVSDQMLDVQPQAPVVAAIAKPLLDSDLLNRLDCHEMNLTYLGISSFISLLHLMTDVAFL